MIHHTHMPSVPRRPFLKNSASRQRERAPGNSFFSAFATKLYLIFIPVHLYGGTARLLLFYHKVSQQLKQKRTHLDHRSCAEKSLMRSLTAMTFLTGFKKRTRHPERYYFDRILGIHLGVAENHWEGGKI